MTTHYPNSHEHAARHRKAALAALALLELPEPPLADSVLLLDDAGWHRLEAAAGIRPCSAETRALVADIYGELTAVRRRLRAAPVDELCDVN